MARTRLMVSTAGIKESSRRDTKVRERNGVFRVDALKNKIAGEKNETGSAVPTGKVESNKPRMVHSEDGSKR
ncbi:hypothetical protein KPH14_002692 [Odynerus spinipes]|uniref:Uncharacterized protein n=1 Tax=Odynerus spinipes TaxID=1348599 RepID=A0AAD9VLH3_9HYME|nr:hypothetical protein KPH14_002692 [Odynerus spinipes]